MNKREELNEFKAKFELPPITVKAKNVHRAKIKAEREIMMRMVENEGAFPLVTEVEGE